MAGIVSAEAVCNGHVTLDDILKLNALMDAQAALEKREIEKAKGKK